jgi:hypothetical protein
LKPPVRTAVWALLALAAILTFYAIFNAGNPRSLFRPLVPDPGYDVAITVGLSVVVAILSIVLLSSRENDPIRNLLEINATYIRELRRKGKSEEAIAESFLRELKAGRGLLYGLARRKVLRYLAGIE